MGGLHLPSALNLARSQFAFVVVWHFLYPAFTIGLASFLAVLEGCWLVTRRAVFLDTFQNWLRIFAIVFAMGVVSGVVMSYQFGTNWSVFSDKVGPVIGPFLGYEVLTAFFLEAGFLGVMLFGLKRVGPRLHFMATCLVAAGTLISTFWILAANSWMQTPAGFARTADVRFIPTSWVHALFNPSFPYRYMHTVVAAYLTTALVVGGVGRLPPVEGQGQSARPADVLHGHVDGCDFRTGPDRPGRPARGQLLPLPADQGGGDGGAVRDRAGRAFAAVRLAGRQGRRDPLRLRNPQARQPVSDPRPQFRGQGPRRLSAQQLADQHPAGLLRLSRHGGLGPADRPARRNLASCCAGGAACTTRGCSSASRWRWGQRASSRSPPAG